MAPTNGTATATSPRRPVPANARDARPVRLGPAREDTVLMDWLSAECVSVQFMPGVEGPRFLVESRAGPIAYGRSLRETVRKVRDDVMRRDAEGGR